MQLIAIWNNEENSDSSKVIHPGYRTLLQDPAHGTWRQTSSLQLANTQNTFLSFKAPCTWRKRCALLHQDAYNLFEVRAQQQNTKTNIQFYTRPLHPKIPDWQHLAYTDGGFITSANRTTQQEGASFFIPKSIHSSNTITCKINPRGRGPPTYKIYRAELAAILVALQQRHTSRGWIHCN